GYSLDDKRLIAAARGHLNRVIAVRFSNDSSLLATGSGDTTVRVFDARTGMEPDRFLAHEATVTGLAFVGEETLGSAGRDGVVRTWAVDPERTLTAPVWRSADVSDILPLPGQLLFAGDKPSFGALDRATGRLIWQRTASY